MSLNSLAVNTVPLNVAPVNNSVLGEGNLLSFEQRVGETGSGNLASFEQKLQRTEASGSFLDINQIAGVKYSGRLFQIRQIVQLRLSSVADKLVSFDQAVGRTEASGSVLKLAQQVRDIVSDPVYTTTFSGVYAREIGQGATVPEATATAKAEATTQVAYKRPFDIEIDVEGFIIPQEWLIGDITTSQEENGAALAEFTLLLGDGAVDDAYLDEATSKAVTITFTDTKTGGSEILFSGKVDVPEIDLLAGEIRYRCTDDYRNRLNDLELPPESMDQFGFIAPDIVSEFESQADEIEERLKSKRESLTFTPAGDYSLTSWTPKVNADRTLVGNEIYRRTPTIELLSGSRVINTVKLELEYQYQRVKQAEAEYKWNHPQNYPCGYARLGQPPTKASIRAAIEGTGWAYTDLVMEDRACGTCNSTWQNFPCTEFQGSSMEDVLDADGQPVTDSNGNVQQKWNPGRQVSLTDKDAASASWKMAKRYTQNVSEKITVTISAGNSIQRYGIRERTERYGLKIDYPVSEWESDPTVYYPTNKSIKLDGVFIQMPTLPNGEYYYDLDNYTDTTGLHGIDRWRKLYDCAVSRAIATIAKTHRENEVTIEVPTNVALGLLESGREVAINMTKTVELAGNDFINCKGVVGAIRHSINCTDKEATTEITIKLSRALNATPEITLIDADGARPTVEFSSSQGLPQQVLTGWTPIYNDEIPEDVDGFVVKRSRQQTFGGQRFAFVVNSPCIEREYIDDAIYENEQGINFTVQIDPLTVGFKR